MSSSPSLSTIACFSLLPLLVFVFIFSFSLFFLSSSPSWQSHFTASPLLSTTGSTYYVATTGSDMNPGTLSQPFKTLAKGVGVLQPGDTLQIRVGTYAESLDCGITACIPGGTSWSAPVTVQAYPGETVIIKPASGNRVIRWQAPTASHQYIILDHLILDATNVTYDVVMIDYDSTNQVAGGTHIRIQNSELRNSHSNCIVVGPLATNVEILHNKLHDCGNKNGALLAGQPPTQVHGIYLESDGNIIDGNEIYNITGYGVHNYNGYTNADGHTNNNIIRNNTIHDVGIWLNTAGQNNSAGIILSSGTGNVAYNNILYNNPVGIKIAYGCTNCAAYNNTVYNNTTGGANIGMFLVPTISGTILANNIVYGQATDIYITSGITATQTNNLVGTNPLFVNPASNDFHLQSGSLAINTGANLSSQGVTTDFDGVSRPQGPAFDAGAYEYTTATPTPTPVTTYVATTGNDSNAGTLAAPFRTLAKGVSVLKPGDILYIRSGTYAEALLNTIPSGISATQMVTVQSYPGERATIKPSSGNRAVMLTGNSFIKIADITFDCSGLNSQGSCIDVTEASQRNRFQNIDVGNDAHGVCLHIGDSNTTLQLGKSSDYNEVVSSNLHNCDLQPGEGTTGNNVAYGLYIESNNNLIDGSTIHDNTGYGIHIFSQHTPGPLASNNIIRNNKIYANGVTPGEILDFYAGILAATGINNLVYNNLIWGNAYGITLGYSASGSKIYNNTISGNKDGAVLASYGGSVLLTNNILYNNPASIVNDGTVTVTPSNNFTADPKFVNPAANDFHLQAGSLAIDKGTNLSAQGVTTDFDGVPRPQGSAYDVGAYEYTSSVIPPSPIPPPPSPPPSVSNLTFTPQLEGKSSIPANTPFTLMFYTPGTTSLKATVTMASDSSAKLTFPSSVSLVSGSYDILIATNSYLKKKQLNVSISSNTTISLNQLTSGDLNSDNSINSLDWSMMNANWFSNNSVSDINGDGITNSLDFSYLNANWNKVGD